MSVSTEIEKSNGTLTRTPTGNDPPRQRVGLDRVDRAVFAVLPEWLRKDAEHTMITAITAIVEEGARGPAIRRLLARDIALSRAQLRHAQFVLNIELQKFEKGYTDARHLDAAEDVVHAHHRRMLASIRELRRIETGHATQIRVSANVAQVNIAEQQA